MVLVNITFAVSPEIDAYFVSWAKSIFLPDYVFNCGFDNPLFCKIKSGDENSAISYAIQMRHSSENEAINWYEQGRGAEILTEIMRQYGDKILWFVTFMDILE